MGFNALIRDPLETVAGNCLYFPFGFQINGTSNPDGLSATLESVVRSEAGEFLCTIRKDLGVPFKCLDGAAHLSTTADDVDLNEKIDWSNVAVDGTFTVRTLAGAVQTDPADNTLAGGYLFLELDDRGP